jgi:hypothetical protein
LEYLPGVCAVLRVHTFEYLASCRFRRRISQCALKRLSGIQDGALTAEQNHHVGAVFHQCAEALFAGAQRVMSTPEQRKEWLNDVRELVRKKFNP